MSVKDLLEQVTQSPKAAAAVSAATTGTGLGTFLDYIPSDIGKLATLVGIILSSVLIRTHWRRGKIEMEKGRLEIDLLRAQLKDHQRVD